MAFGGRFDAILFGLGNRGYRIYTASNICLHFGPCVGRVCPLTNFYVAVTAILIGGFAMTVAGTDEHTLIQASVDEDMRGRVVSLYGAISRRCPSLGSLMMGWIGGHVGLRWPIAGGAVICIVVLSPSNGSDRVS